jgi:integrase
MFTVSHLIDTFDRQLEHAVNTGSKSIKTRDWYGWQFKKLRAAAGSLPAAEVRIWHLHSVKITHHFARALRALFAWSTENDLTPKNPFAKLEVPKCGQRERVISRTDVAKLYLSAARRFRRYLFILTHTMARPSEIRLLRWSEVDLEKRVISLSRFKAKDKRRDGVRVRQIPLDRRSVMMLKAMRRKAVSPFVFSDSDGEAWTYNTVRSRMRACRKRAGLDDGDERVVCYTLRHTGATNAMRAGIQTTLLAKIMGHSKVTTTQRYQHPTTDDMVDAIDRLSERKHRDG